jgi:hypothetical protein
MNVDVEMKKYKIRSIQIISGEFIGIKLLVAHIDNSTYSYELVENYDTENIDYAINQHFNLCKNGIFCRFLK